MSSTPDADSSSQIRPSSERDGIRTGSPEPPSTRPAEGQSTSSPEPVDPGLTGTQADRPVGRRRRNRRDQSARPGHDQPRPTEAVAGDRPASVGATPPAKRSDNQDWPATTPRRPEPSRPPVREAPQEQRRRRTEGTRSPSQGNGRGLSGSPRNPNHYGEIPIRPDNTTFDATHDRLVCIARHHVIPEDFPVHYRRMTASSRLEVVATSGSDLLLCDHSHIGPHIWPDQSVVGDRPEADLQADSGERIQADSGAV